MKAVHSRTTASWPRPEGPSARALTMPATALAARMVRLLTVVLPTDPPNAARTRTANWEAPAACLTVSRQYSLTAAYGRGRVTRVTAAGDEPPRRADAAAGPRCRLPRSRTAAG